jgi:hypothetical protein
MTSPPGGRVLLEREGVSADTVRYRATLFAGAVETSAEVNVRLSDGEVVFGAWSSEPPAWLVDLARMFLRMAWKKQEWPQRINRWREAP